MENVSLKLQTDIKTIMSTFETMRNEAKDLYNLYWKGSVSADISLLGSSDPVCKAAKLSKQNAVDGITLISELNDFWDNAAVSTGDHIATCQTIRHGDSLLADAISSDLEDYGDRLKQYCTDLITQYNRGRNAYNAYLNSELSLAVAAISTHTIVFGSDMSKDDLSSAITLISQFTNFLENAAVTTGDYKSTLAKWYKL